MRIPRRSFLEAAAVSGVASCFQATADAGSLPTRVLSKTSSFDTCMGGGSGYLMYKEEDQAIEIVRALDLGITYIDTSDDYGDNHLSEQRIGKAITGRRKQIFLATKLSNRSGEEAERIVEASFSAPASGPTGSGAYTFADYRRRSR